MTLADLLDRVLLDRPGLTTTEVWRALGTSGQSKARDPRTVETVLRMHCARFERSDDGRWFPAGGPDDPLSGRR